MGDQAALTVARAARERWYDAAALVAVLGVVAWSCWQRYHFLAASPYPVGIDGYFYPIQLESILDGQGLHFPSAPLTLWWMTPFAALTDPITGAKLGAALGCALIALPVYGLGRRISGDRAVGVLAAVVAGIGAGSFYLSAEFVKNGVGLTVAAAYLLALLRALERPSRGRIAIAVLALVAAVLAHKMAAAIAVVASIAPCAVALRRERWWAELAGRSPRLPTIVLGATAALVVGVVIAGTLAPKSVLGVADVRLITDAFRGTADWSLPALDVGHGRPPLTFNHEPLMAAVIALLAIGALVMALRDERWRPVGVRKPDMAMGASFAVLAVLVGLPWLDVGDPNGLPFRLRIIAFFPLAICAATVAGVAIARWRLDRMTVAACLVPFAAGWLWGRIEPSDEGVVKAHPAMVSAVHALEGVVPDSDDLIVNERHIMFMAIWYTKNRAQLTTRDIEPEHRWRLITLAFIGVRSPLRDALAAMRAAPPPDVPLPRPLHPRDPDGLIVMPEVTWQYLLEHLEPGPRAYYGKWRTI